MNGLIAPSLGGFLAYGLDSPASYPPVTPARPFLVELVAFLDASLPGLAIYPGHLPRKGVSFPALVYNRVSGDRWIRLSGPSGVAEVTVQFDCYSPDDFAALAADDRLRRALQPLAGLMGTVRVLEANLHDQASEYEPAAEGSDLGTYRHRSEFLFFYLQP
jgi:hypothetical protein